MSKDTALGKFSSGHYTYSYEILMPLDALAFGARVFKLAGGGIAALIAAKNQGTELDSGSLFQTFAEALRSIDEDKLSQLMTESIQRCYTPENQALSDALVFQRWFRDHPEELYPVGVLAIYNLVKDFFPLSLVTTPSGSPK